MINDNTIYSNTIDNRKTKLFEKVKFENNCS